MSDSSEEEYRVIENKYILETHVHRAHFQGQLKKKSEITFGNALKKNKHLTFDLDISLENATTLFLHWLIKYGGT
jgi:hypothetical protein